uniref:Fe2OG dioxygenase domain-containing protein n=1 Tax=Nelumbo nucifera TaxID=4432 RepID=A0A822ZJY4_NELNU|nr:TPA_asm: hypothetical protein HUJ06_001975 [Nelumbo nucifera]
MAPSFENIGNELFNFVVREGNGVKGMVDSGITTVPDQYIQSPQERIVKQGIDPSYPPSLVSPIDLSELEGPNHDQVVELLGQSAETLGFFQVINHGVQVELLEQLKDAAHRPSPFVKYGTSFVPEAEKALEWKDYISMTYSGDEDALNFWPEECKEVALEYLKSSTKMVKRILEVLLRRLGVTVDHTETEAYIGTRMVNMNLVSKSELTVGVGRHSDMGILTVLLQDGIGGLYVKVEDDRLGRKKGEWVEIPPTPGALVVNVGDTLEILSNGRYKSAEHRVWTTNAESRVSIPVFVFPLPTKKIKPLPQVVEKDGVAHYGEFLFEEYMKNFFGKGHEGKKSLDFVKITMSPS